MASSTDIPSNDSDFLPKSQTFQCSTLNSLKSNDSNETPLQTPWTMWLDK